MRSLPGGGPHHKGGYHPLKPLELFSDAGHRLLRNIPLPQETVFEVTYLPPCPEQVERPLRCVEQIAEPERGQKSVPRLPLDRAGVVILQALLAVYVAVDGEDEVTTGNQHTPHLAEKLCGGERRQKVDGKA